MSAKKSNNESPRVFAVPLNPLSAAGLANYEAKAEGESWADFHEARATAWYKRAQNLFDSMNRLERDAAAEREKSDNALRNQLDAMGNYQRRIVALESQLAERDRAIVQLVMTLTR